MYVQTILIHGLNAIHSDTNAMNTTLLNRSSVNTSDPWVALLQSALNRFFHPVNRYGIVSATQRG